jgi:hypothetical protein
LTTLRALESHADGYADHDAGDTDTYALGPNNEESHADRGGDRPAHRHRSAEPLDELGVLSGLPVGRHVGISRDVVSEEIAPTPMEGPFVASAG